MKTAVLYIYFASIALGLNCEASQKIPALFYSSSDSGLSANVLNHLKSNPLNISIILYDISGNNNFLEVLNEVGKKYCKFSEGRLGGIPLLFDGKKCYSSDVGVIKFLKQNSR